MKRALRTVLPLAIAMLLISTALRAAETRIASVGEESVSERDVLFLISAQVGDTGDGMKTGLALVQMDDAAKRDMIDRLTQELLFYQAAKEMQLDRRPETARMLHWQAVHTLSGLYMTDVASKWDLGEEAAKKYYEAHLEEFMDAEAIRMKYMPLPDGFDVATISDDLKTSGTLEEFVRKGKAAGTISTTSAIEESGWMERGLVKRDFEAAFFANGHIGLLPPLISDNVTYLIEITERRPPRQLSWEEAAMEAVQRLQRQYVRQEAERLREKYPIKIDETMLKNLGGAQSAPR